VTVTRRILFVDDEPLVLDGLKRSLRPLRSECELVFVKSAEDGLRELQEKSFDVVVSDMLMPGMNGSVFLEQVGRRCPAAVRFILSGYSDRDVLIRCAESAHQTIAKPCNPETLKAVLRRAVEWCEKISNRTIREVICRTGRLPTPHAVRCETVRALGHSAITESELACTVVQDVGMAAMVLKIANSGVFARRKQISSIAEAVASLGLETIRSLAELKPAAASRNDLNPQWQRHAELLCKHSLDTAIGAQTIARIELAEQPLVDESFASGLLHDIGKFLLVSSFPEQYSAAVRLAVDERIDLTEAEKRVFGVSHAETGAALLELWGFSLSTVDAVSHHHFPSLRCSDSFTALTAVHVANAVAHERDRNAGCGSRLLCDSVHLHGIGLAPRLAIWRDAVREMLSIGSLVEEQPV
jgi:putative nucleotidyltransferase with HDIG domain